MTSIVDVWQEYADALGKSLDTLTEAEKKQAFLNAILDGQRIEPFATWVAIGKEMLARCGVVKPTLDDIIREKADDTTTI